MRILAIGDVVGEPGIDCLRRTLWALRKEKRADFCVVNGENAHMSGITPNEAENIFSAGADVITLGNHVFRQGSIIPRLEERPNILRPANLSPAAPGVGWCEYETPIGRVAVINLIGRLGMDPAESPFFEAERILKRLTAKIILVDFHAEATSEKGALAWHLDGRISALWGTHTHVQTSDAGILPGGTGFVTDIGMTGAVSSILGVKPEQSIQRFLGDPRRIPYSAPGGARKLEGALFEIDNATGKCMTAEAFRIIK